MATHCTYITVHEATGLYYLGKASLLSIHTRKYKGSGVKLRESFKVYPRDEWKCVILWEFDSSDEAYSDEAGIVTDEVLRDPLCLNITRGGGKNQGKQLSEEQRKKFSENNKRTQGTESARAAHRRAMIRRYSDPAEREATSRKAKLQWERWRAAKAQK